MKELLLGQMGEEYEDLKKIINGDYSEIERLEENPIVQRYKELLKMRENRYGFENEDAVVSYLLSKYGQGFIQETNGIWCLICEIPAGKYEEWFNTTLNGVDENEMMLLYFDIEDSSRRVVIKKEEQEEFEASNNVITGKLSINDPLDRFYNVRFEFFKSCVNNGQGFAIQEILAKYSKYGAIKSNGLK